MGTYFARINLEDTDRVHNEKERYVPFSAPPFREGDDHHVKQADRDRLVKAADQDATHQVIAAKAEGEAERHPEWLELSGDLAWTATFSSLTSAVQITDTTAISNYTAFFALTWHLWATQAVYDINYYSNDWFHRGAFAIQLVGYATLSAFSGNFKVLWGVEDSSPPVDINNSTAVLIAQATENHDLNGMKASFHGVNAVLVINRLALLIQYARILWYRRKYRKLSWGSLATPISLLVAIILFASCFILVSVAERTRTAAIIQVCLWCFAIAIQIVGQFLTPDERQDALFEDTDLTPRMSTLTVIILGEGLNGICSVLQHSVNSLGLTRATMGVGISLAIVLYFIWLLYFDGYRSVRRPSKTLQDSWLWLHAPFHLFLILMLQGLKNAFLANSVLAGSTTFTHRFVTQLEAFKDNGAFVASEEMTKILEKLKMSWDVQIVKFNTALNISEEAGLAEIWRYYGTVLHSVVLEYIEEPDTEGEDLYQSFITLNDTALAADLQDPMSPLISGWYDKLVNQVAFATYPAMALAGAVFISIGLLNALQRTHRDRYASAYTINRLVAGLFLVIYGIVASFVLFAKDANLFIHWIIPTIAIVAAVAGIVDQLLLRFSVRSIRKQETLVRVPTSSPGGEKYTEAKGQEWDTLLPTLRSDGQSEAYEMADSKEPYDDEGAGLRLRGDRH